MRAVVAIVLLVACRAGGKPPAGGTGPGAAAGGTVVKLCDNHTTVTVDPDRTRTRADGEAISDALMAQWRLQHPDADWQTEVRRSHPRIPSPADNRELLAGGQRTDQVYGNFGPRDLQTWERETSRMVEDGAAVFHDATALGSTIAVSCDMCHPDAANTHPETYPKYQTQLGRVALLRDMINWCLEHPVRAPAMAPDDPRMRAMEAYITAQRTGTALRYGKH